MKRTSLKNVLVSFAMVLAMIATLVMPEFKLQANAASVSIVESEGWLESAYVEWKAVSGATGYRVYVKEASASDSKYVQLDDMLIRQYADYYRADAVGLAAGNYVLRVEAIDKSGVVAATTTKSLKVSSYDRSGFAFSSDSVYKTGSGAYNDDGTLKSNAQVVYVTADTAKTCTAVVNGTKVSGFQAILDAKQKAGTKDTSPITFRIIGTINAEDVDKFSSSSEGIQLKGKSANAEMNITIEGIGEDATIKGFGFLIRNSGNVEMRNFAVMNFMDDGISLDTNNTNIWIHNVDLFYGATGSDADQAKGDGSIDVKAKSTYVTISYNHFYDSGKCSLCGMSDTEEFMVTYHHNWFDHSDSRHPRIRVASVHVYNNYFDGNAKYGVGVTKGSSAFVEANYFNGCKAPMMSSGQGTDAAGQGTFSGEAGGMIKAFANYVTGASSLIYANSNDGTKSANAKSFDAYLASTRSETVPSSYKTVSGGTTYNNFDTKYDLGVSESDIDDAKDVPTIVTTYAGRMNGGDFKWTFTTADNAKYAIDKELKNAIVNYKSSVKSIGGNGGNSSATVSPSDKTETTESKETTATKETTTESKETTATKETTTESKETTATKETTSNGSTATTATGKEHNFTKSGLVSDYYTIKGSTSDSKGSVSYNGLTLKTCLKMENSTNVSFSAEKEGTLTLVFGQKDTDKAVKVDGKEYATDANGIVTVELASGTHAITKSAKTFLYYISYVEKEEVKEDTTTTKSTKTSSVTLSNGTIDLSKYNDKELVELTFKLSAKYTGNGTIELYGKDGKRVDTVKYSYSNAKECKVDLSAYSNIASMKVKVKSDSANATMKTFKLKYYK